MNEFIAGMVEKAKVCPQRVCFPESWSPDIVKTAAEVVRTKIGTPVLIGNRAEVEKLAAENGVSTEGFEYFDSKDEAFVEAWVDDYIAKNEGKRKKPTMKRLTSDPVRCGMFLLKAGDVDCVAAGKEYSTGDVITEAMQGIGLQPGVQSASSLGIADIPGFDGPQGQMLGLADCAVTAQPDAETLAGIAISSADTVRDLLGWEPRVALLAFSTTGSAKHETVDVVIEAVQKVHELRPDIKCDGEFQLDAAIDPEVAAKKVKHPSEVAGKANILIFPDLNSANIAIKLCQRFAGSLGIGHTLSGFRKAVADSSRGSSVEEMVGDMALVILAASE